MKCGWCKETGVSVGHVKACSKTAYGVKASETGAKVAAQPSQAQVALAVLETPTVQELEALLAAPPPVEVAFPKMGRYTGQIGKELRHYIVKPSKSGKGYCAFRVHGHYAGFIFNDGGVSTKDYVDKPFLLQILEAGPQAAAILYGKTTGHCSICGRLLTDPASVEAGIGPVCAKGTLWAS